MAGLSWYLARLSRMSPGEINSRVRDRAVKEALRLRRRRISAPDWSPTPFPKLPAGIGLQSVAPSAARALLDSGEKLLAGEWEYLGVRRTDMVAPDWFLDPATGGHAPAMRFAFDIDHRAPRPFGSPKNVWEISRQHHVTVLATAFFLSGDERYAERAAGHLESWWRENPFLRGFHWTSGIEVGLRLVAWVWARRLLDEWPRVRELFEQSEVFADQLYWHQLYLDRLPSHSSSANNHLIAESVGLLTASLAFPWFSASAQWFHDASRRLVRALESQTTSAGMNAEMATDYHGFVLELAMLAIVESVLADRRPPDGLVDIVVEMADAIAALADAELRLPRRGDSDDAVGLLVDAPGGNRWASILASLAAALTPRPWWPDVGNPDVRSTLWRAVLSDAALGGDRPSSPRPALAREGTAVLKAFGGTADEIWVFCNGGPLGYLETAAHGHADALAVEIRRGGTPLVVDSGTYVYGEDRIWRRYFRSTAAHSTVEVGHASQAEDVGPFLWTGHPSTTVTNASVESEVEVWSADHDGYTRMEEELVHEREVQLDGPQRLVRVVDRFHGVAPAPARLAFHLAPDVECSLENGRALLGQGRDQEIATVDLPPELAWSVVRGSVEPILGWYSPAYGIKQPTSVLVGDGKAAPATEWVTTFVIEPVSGESGEGLRPPEQVGEGVG